MRDIIFKISITLNGFKKIELLYPKDSGLSEVCNSIKITQKEKGK